MKKQHTLILVLILALTIFLYGYNIEEDLPIISPTYEYQINGEKQQNLKALSFATIDSVTKDTLIYLFDDQNKGSKVELRFNHDKIEAWLTYNDTIYYSDVLAFAYREENGRLHGRFSFNAFHEFKFVPITKGRFNDIDINNLKPNSLN